MELSSEVLAQPVVLDVGRVYIKFGISGESTPRGIVRTNIAQLLTQQTPATVEDFQDALRPALRHIFFSGLQVRTSERTALVCEHVICPYALKQAISNLLFVSFKFPFVCFVLKPTLCVLSSGAFLRPAELSTPVTNGLVISCSYFDTYVVPVIEGVCVCKALSYHRLGMRALHFDLAQTISQNTQISSPVPPHSSIEDIVVQSCFVDPLSGDAAREIMPPDTIPKPVVARDINVTFNNTESVLRGRERGLAGDVFFGGDSEGISVASLVLDSLTKCEPDMIAAVVPNVVLSGGTTMLEGFQFRLEQQLRLLTVTDANYSHLKGAVARMKFYQSPFPANTIAWVGGSIFGKQEDALQNSGIASAEFAKNPQVANSQDWTAITESVAEGSAGNAPAKRKPFVRANTQHLLRHARATGSSAKVVG